MTHIVDAHIKDLNCQCTHDGRKLWTHIKDAHLECPLMTAK